MAGNAGDQPDVLGQWLATRSAVGTATADTLRGRVRTDGPSALEQRRASGGPDSEDDEDVSGDAAVDLVDLDEEPEPAPVAGDEALPERLDPLLDYRVPVADRPRRAAPAPATPAPAAPAPAAPAPVAPRSPEPDARSRMHGLEHAFQDVLAAVRAEPAPAARPAAQPTEDATARERAEAEAARADKIAAELRATELKEAEAAKADRIAAELRAAELKEAEARAAEEAQRKAEADATAAARAAAEAEAAEAAQRKAEAKAAAKAAAEARVVEEAQRKADEAQRKADAKAAAKAAARAAADAREAEETQRKADEAQRKADAKAAARAAVEAREAEEAQRKLDEAQRKADEARRKAEAKAAARTKVAEPPATPSTPATPATPSGKSAKESAEEFAWKHPLAPTAPEGPRIHPDVLFKPRRAAQHLASLLMVVTAPLAGYAGWLAYEERTRTNLGVFAILAILTVAIWALRISAAPASVRVVQGILEIDDSGKHYSWDLSSSYTPIEVFGTPGRLRWKVWLHTPGGATYVVHSGVVKPREFMRVLRQYRPES